MATEQQNIVDIIIKRITIDLKSINWESISIRCVAKHSYLVIIYSVNKYCCYNQNMSQFYPN